MTYDLPFWPRVLVHHGSLDVQLANLLSLGVEVGVVAVEPVNTPVRFQVGFFKNPPDRRATHGQVMSSPVDQGSGQVIQRPPGGGTILLVGRAAGQRDHIEPYRGGKLPRSTRPRLILKTGQSVLQVAVSPHRDGVSIAPKLSGDLKVARMVLRSGPENQPGSQDQGLRRGTGPDQSLELGTLWIGQTNNLRERHRHGEHPCSWGPRVIFVRE